MPQDSIRHCMFYTLCILSMDLLLMHVETHEAATHISCQDKSRLLFHQDYPGCEILIQKMRNCIRAKKDPSRMNHQ